ncbi:hypothetical protein BH09PSE2_BH09PSE2_08170 [soil metagenome]
MTDSRNRVFGWLAAGLVGVVVGVVATLAVQASLGRLLWIDAGSAWIRLPSQAVAGPLPQTFTTPAKAWDYGATTEPLAGSTQARPSILRIELAKVAGPVGLSLAKQAGGPLVSRERLVFPGDAQRFLYFRITAAQGPITILVRNYGGDGKAGSVEVRSVTYAVEKKLSDREMQAVIRAGLN